MKKPFITVYPGISLRDFLLNWASAWILMADAIVAILTLGMVSTRLSLQFVSWRVIQDIKRYEAKHGQNHES